MTVNVSDRLRDALERLDQAIDRLDGHASADTQTVPPQAPANAAIAAKLDRMIERIETALAD
jgi:hypothetical protein